MDDDVFHRTESLCMRCGESGTTTLLYKSIPHFEQILVSSFECKNCGERNRETQYAGPLQPRGCRLTLHVPKGDREVLNRQVVKSDYASITIPELGFDIPAETQRGVLSTVEGVLLTAAEELCILQDERRKVDPEQAQKIDDFIVRLREHAAGNHDFTFVLDDISGNSYIENPHAPEKDPLLTEEVYERTPEQHEQLGFIPQSDESTSGNETYVPAGTRSLPHGSVGAESASEGFAKGDSKLLDYSAPEEVMTFPATCGACAAACDTRMYKTNIPYFKEVIVMASTCDVCGYKDSELKPGGDFSEMAKKITLRVMNVADLSRDLIKSTTSSVSIPELELELEPGTLGGMVTTVEGLVMQISEKMKGIQLFRIGDSAAPEGRKKWQEFQSRLEGLMNVKEPWTLVLDDPLSNSFIAPGRDTAVENDEQLTIQQYERTKEQNDELGFNDAVCS